MSFEFSRPKIAQKTLVSIVYILQIRRPVAQQTKLGWCATGADNSKGSASCPIHFILKIDQRYLYYPED